MSQIVAITPAIFRGASVSAPSSASGTSSATVATLSTGGVKYDFPKALTKCGWKAAQQLRVGLLGTGYDANSSDKIPSLTSVLKWVGPLDLDVYELDPTAALESASKIRQSSRVRRSRVFVGDVVDVMWLTLVLENWEKPGTKHTLADEARRWVKIEEETSGRDRQLADYPIFGQDLSFKINAWQRSESCSLFPGKGYYDAFITTRAVAYPSRYFSKAYRDVLLLWILALLKPGGWLIVDNGTSLGALTQATTTIRSRDQKTISIRGVKCPLVLKPDSQELALIQKGGGSPNERWLTLKTMLETNLTTPNIPAPRREATLGLKVPIPR